ncbi:MAG: DUF3047 domain-containing protein [Terriglobia bacterium]
MPVPAAWGGGMTLRRTPILVLLLLLLAMVSSACQAKAKVNEFTNPGFEDGKGDWFSMTTGAWGEPFQVSRAQARSGENSAYLRIRSKESGVKVYGVVQEVAPREFPEVVSGYYRAESWKKGAPIQYLQFVVIVFGMDLPGDDLPNHQIRYILSSLDKPPFAIGNAKFVFVNSKEPRLGEWVPFKRNIKKDFEELWGAAPGEFSEIRVLFEARYEGKEAEDPEVVADVYYDDLKIGREE